MNSKTSCCRTKATPTVGIPKHGGPAIIRGYRPITLPTLRKFSHALLSGHSRGCKKSFTMPVLYFVQPFHPRCYCQNIEPYRKCRTDASTNLHRTSGLPGDLRRCIIRLLSLYPRNVQAGSYSLSAISHSNIKASHPRLSLSGVYTSNISSYHPSLHIVLKPPTITS
jgi:hypothetical protein